MEKCHGKIREWSFFHDRNNFLKLRKLEYWRITKIEARIKYKYASKFVFN